VAKPSAPAAPARPRETPPAREARKAQKIAAANLTLAAQLAEGQTHALAWMEWDNQVRENRLHRTRGAIWLGALGLLTGISTATVPFWVDENSVGLPLAAGLGLSIGLLVMAYVVAPPEVQ
jgi:hypothetical protein